MSAITLPRNTRLVNRCRRKFDRYASPTDEERADLWRESVALESIAPAGLRGGLARARTRLLSGVPSWRLPAVLDSLILEGATA